jgi:mRNA interferase RelE/StbE
MFDIRYSKQAVDFLESAEKKLITRILKKIETLKENPVQHDSKVVEGYNEKLFRIRVGDYRILYEVDHKKNQLGIVKIDKRSKVY